MPRFLCLERRSNDVVYEAGSLSQAVGFVDGADEPLKIALEIESQQHTAINYRVCVVDQTTGQIVCGGPVIDGLSIPDALVNLALVFLPACIPCGAYTDLPAAGELSEAERGAA